MQLELLTNKKTGAMLGVDKKRSLVTGKFAIEIREQVRRIQTERLNADDKKTLERSKKIMSENTVVWR